MLININNPHCDISSFHFVIIFLNCKETLWTPCIFFLIALFTSSISFSLEDNVLFSMLLFIVNLERSIAFASTMPCVAQTFIIAFANCINSSPSTALNGLTSDTANATELFNTVSFITFDKLMSNLLKYAVTLGDIFALYLHRFK